MARPTTAEGRPLRIELGKSQSLLSEFVFYQVEIPHPIVIPRPIIVVAIALGGAIVHA